MHSSLRHCATPIFRHLQNPRRQEEARIALQSADRSDADALRVIFKRLYADCAYRKLKNSGTGKVPKVELDKSRVCFARLGDAGSNSVCWLVLVLPCGASQLLPPENSNHESRSPYISRSCSFEFCSVTCPLRPHPSEHCIDHPHGYLSVPATPITPLLVTCISDITRRNKDTIVTIMAGPSSRRGSRGRTSGADAPTRRSKVQFGEPEDENIQDTANASMDLDADAVKTLIHEART